MNIFFPEGNPFVYSKLTNTHHSIITINDICIISIHEDAKTVNTRVIWKIKRPTKPNSPKIIDFIINDLTLNSLVSFNGFIIKAPLLIYILLN